MTHKRVTLLVVGLGCLLAASALVFAAGLPDRAAFTGRIDASGQQVAPELGALAPSFRATLANGAAFDLAELNGRAVIVNFWATWCGPCRVEMPELEALQQAYGGRGLAVVGVNTGETLDDVVRAYRGSGVCGCIITKTDEAVGIATALDVAIRQQLALHYVTDGQRVPEDLHLPDRESLLQRALHPLERPSVHHLDQAECQLILATAAGGGVHAGAGLG